jgi:hypothetical protein
MEQITITHTILSLKEIQELPDGTSIRILYCRPQDNPIDGKGNLKSVSRRLVKLADGITDPEYFYDKINKCYTDIQTWQECEKAYVKDILFIVTQVDRKGR